MNQRTPDERKVLHVVVHNFNEPWEDTNGNGAYDAGERFVDISAGYHVFDTTGTRGTIWTAPEIERALAGLKGGLASAGIRVVVDSSIIHEPIGKLFAQAGAPGNPANTLGYFDPFDDDLIPGTPVSRDHTIIQENFRSPTQFNSNENDDVLDIYFTAPFSDGDYGVQWRAGHIFTLSPALDSNLVNTVFVGLNSSRDGVPMVLAHEALHQLTNRADVETPAHILFPSRSWGSNEGRTSLFKRRIQESTASDARKFRSNMTNRGNKLLRSP